MSGDEPICPNMPGFRLVAKSWSPEAGWWCLYESVWDPSVIIDVPCQEPEACC